MEPCICSTTEVLDLLDDIDDAQFEGVTSGVAAVIDCTGEGALSFTETQWTAARSKITADDAWIRFIDTEIQRSPLCYEDTAWMSNCMAYPNNGRAFLELAGSSQGLNARPAGGYVASPTTGDEELVVRGFLEGLHFEGTDGTALNVEFDQQCGDSVTNEATGVGNQVFDAVIKNGCDKCVEDSGNNNIAGLSSCSIDDAVTESTDRRCYHIGYHKVLFENCKQPIRWDSEGTFLLKDVEMKNTPSSPTCAGPFFGPGSDPLFVRVQGGKTNDCTRGFLVGGNTQAVFHDTEITNNDKRGLFVRNGAQVWTDHSVITGNGGTVESVDEFKYYGGVAIADESVLDDDSELYLGDVPGSTPEDCTDPSTRGCNTICDNRGRDNARKTFDSSGVATSPPANNGPMETHNGRGDVNKSTPFTLVAENNYWCGTEANPVPTSELFGLIDTDPPLTTDPN